MRLIISIAQAYHDICAGEEPWIALGNFMNEWFDYSKEERGLLVAEVLHVPSSPTAMQSRWALFCAASVEYLSLRAEIQIPAWVECFSLPLTEPWYEFDAPGLVHPAVQARLRASTPEPFARRNIFCGDRVFANKYEFAAQRKQRATS